MSNESQHEGRSRRRVIYRGRVQGVGFRLTTVSIARRYPVEGYVKNLPDGRVEVVVDGPTDGVQKFLQDVESAFQSHIRDFESESLEPDEPFGGFEVRYA